MQKKKILFVVHQMNHGGVQKSLIAALNAIDYTQNEVTLYIRKNRTQLIDAVNPNVKHIVINGDQTHYYRRPYMIYLQIYKKIYAFLKKKSKVNEIQHKIASYLNREQMKYEITHYAEIQESYDVAISYIQGYTAKFVAQHINAKKKIMFFHGSTDETHELHEEIMPHFDSIVGVNENVQHILEELYPKCADRMTYIENYVDAEEIREKAKAFTIEKKRNQIVLCTCGRLMPVKGFDLAVEAAKILQEKGISFHWWFVGDGGEKDSLKEKIVDANLESSIEITGMQHNPYVFMQACDIYVQPSYEEAYGLTIAEAKILCKPIVSTATIGGELQIKNKGNGILTGISGKEIAEGILMYIQDDNLKCHVETNLQNTVYYEMLQRYKQQWKETLEG